MTGMRMLLALLLMVAAPAQARLNVIVDTSQPERVLAIARTLAEKEVVGDEEWKALFDTAGYRDLKARETAMNRAFTDDDFRAFVSSPEVVERRHLLSESLSAWRGFDIESAAAKAMLYLPEGASITATVYPLIKPKPNSFVFRTDRGMAIFLYLDPARSQEQFENTVIHELHHIGYDSACGGSAGTSGDALARRYLGGFGEGLAVLAAAGGADVHPHAASPAGERELWDRDAAKVAANIPRLEAFFTAILDGELSDRSSIAPRFMELIATEQVPQGAFYTVGWTMAAAIERARGREALVTMICDPVAMMRAYNAIAGDEALPRWSEGMLDRLATAP
jgi:hypothetical protein